MSSLFYKYLGEPEFLINYFIKCEQDPYDENTNEDGLINMGTAVNALCEDMIEQRILKVHSLLYI